MGDLDALASKAPYTDPATGRTFSLADRIGACRDPGDVPRLFANGDSMVFQACLNPISPNLQCRRCVKAQDGGTNCNFWSLLDWDNNLPSLPGLSAFKCLRKVMPEPGYRAYPQVVCQPIGTTEHCVPRFYPGNVFDENSAMCVPIDPKCAPCYDMLDPGVAVEHVADRAACLEAPAFCRVSRGQVNEYSCDARAFAQLIDQHLVRIPIPYRCRLELPLSRVDLQPDGYRVVLSNGFPCRGGTSPAYGRAPTDCRPCVPGLPCNVGALNQDQLKYIVWDQLTGLLGGNLGLQDIQAPGCYPTRNEFGQP